MSANDSITREQVLEIATKYAALFDIEYKGEMWEFPLPTVVEGDHEGSDCPFIISWECGPTDGWVHDDRLDEIAKQVLGTYAYSEAINHFAVAFYFA